MGGFLLFLAILAASLVIAVIRKRKENQATDTYSIVVNRTAKLWTIGSVQNRTLMLYAVGMVDEPEINDLLVLSWNRLPSGVQLALVKMVTVEGLQNGTL
jgi:hypothetical protein